MGRGCIVLEKSEEVASNVFIFEWKDEITFTLKGNGEVTVENSYGYSTTSPKSTSVRQFKYQKSGVYKTKLTLQANVKFILSFVNKKIQDNSTTYHYESSLTRILSAIPVNISRVTTNASFAFYTPDFASLGQIQTPHIFMKFQKNYFNIIKNLPLLTMLFIIV